MRCARPSKSSTERPARSDSRARSRVTPSARCSVAAAIQRRWCRSAPLTGVALGRPCERGSDDASRTRVGAGHQVAVDLQRRRSVTVAEARRDRGHRFPCVEEQRRLEVAPSVIQIATASERSVGTNGVSPSGPLIDRVPDEGRPRVSKSCRQRPATSSSMTSCSPRRQGRAGGMADGMDNDVGCGSAASGGRGLPEPAVFGVDAYVSGQRLTGPVVQPMMRARRPGSSASISRTISEASAANIGSGAVRRSRSPSRVMGGAFLARAWRPSARTTDSASSFSAFVRNSSGCCASMP